MFFLLLKVLVALCSVFLVFYLWVIHRYGYWKRRNMHSLEPTFPFGNMGEANKNYSMGFHYMNLYNENKSQPYVGFFILFSKVLLINDLDLIKNILTKDYASFQGHGFKTDKHVDPLNQHLFNLEGDEWKRIRVKLTPTFTSSKMKYMFETFVACTKEMVSYIEENIKDDNVIDIKEVAARFGTDVIGSCAFGIQTNSFKYPDAEFRKAGKAIYTITPSKAFAEVVSALAPEWAIKLRVARQTRETTKFFEKTVKETIDYREQNKVERKDFLQLLIDMKKADEKTGTHLTLPELTAQCFVFFAAGFETSSTTTTYTLLELAKNPDICKTLVDEIDKTIEENDGEITYEALSNMPYLTKVIQETLRIYPPATFHFRRCTKNYPVPDSDAVIEKGTLVVISTLGIHRDPDIYPNPMQFDPERFSQENVQNRHPFAHIPFGEGPRICIGMRFGVMQVKLALSMILRSFHVELCAKTQVPPNYSKRSFLLSTEGGVYLKLTSRRKTV